MIKGKILLMPPVGKAEADVKINLGQHLKNEISRMTQGRLIYAMDVPELRKVINQQNLMPRGKINKQELIDTATALYCDTVIFTELIDTEQLPPQRMVIRILMLKVSDKDVVELSSAVLDINMESAFERKKFSKFIRHSEKAEFLDRWNGKSSDYQVDTARLSPSRFREYSACQVAFQLYKDFK